MVRWFFARSSISDVWCFGLLIRESHRRLCALKSTARVNLVGSRRTVRVCIIVYWLLALGGWSEVWMCSL